MERLKPCPRCGTKAYVSRDVADGFYFGWSAGCPRYCHNDGIHGTTIHTSEKDCYAIRGANSKEEAIKHWNKRVEHLKKTNKETGYDKIHEEMQNAQLRSDQRYVDNTIIFAALPKNCGRMTTVEALTEEYQKTHKYGLLKRMVKKNEGD